MSVVGRHDDGGQGRYLSHQTGSEQFEADEADAFQ